MLAIVLALVAAALFAVAAVAQQRGTTGIADDDALGAGFIVALVHRPVWLAGIGADIAGFVVGALALGVGSLLVVQPLLVTTVLFALPLAAWSDHRRLTRAEWGWAAVLALGLIAFFALGDPTQGLDQAPARRWMPILVLAAPLVAGCVGAASVLSRGRARSLLLAIAAGVLLGLSGPFTKSAVRAFDGGLGAGLSTWELWAMALCAALGTFWQQSSYQAGDVQTSLPAVTVLKPVVAMGIGVTIYEEALLVSDLAAVGLVASLLAMGAATVALGRLAAGDPAPTAAPQSPRAADP